MEDINKAETDLTQEFEQLEDKSQILKSKTFKQLYLSLAQVDASQKPELGRKINNLKNKYLALAYEHKESLNQLNKTAIDLSAPYNLSYKKPKLDILSKNQGSLHPISIELNKISQIFELMGFSILTPRELDDDWHMFGSLNFPKDHPARDDFDTFMTNQVDKDNNAFVAAAHTSTMQNRALIDFKDNLNSGEAIAVIVPGRVFRHEDVDSRHDHTFYQYEGIYVDKNVSIGNLIAVLQNLLTKYFDHEVEVTTQPYYFPFTEPSFEFNTSCPFCDKTGCSVCSYTGFIEIIGCGMIHPNVLRNAGIDPGVYSGFAFGGGIDRLVMIKWKIVGLSSNFNLMVKILS